MYVNKYLLVVIPNNRAHHCQTYFIHIVYV